MKEKKKENESIDKTFVRSFKQKASIPPDAK